MSARSLLLTNALLTDPAAGTQMRGALLIADGMIADLGPGLTKDKVGSDVEILDCGGEVLAPGLIDMRAVTGEPGATADGMRSLVAGFAAALAA